MFILRFTASGYCFGIFKLFLLNRDHGLLNRDHGLLNRDHGLLNRYNGLQNWELGLEKSMFQTVKSRGWLYFSEVYVSLGIFVTILFNLIDWLIVDLF